jgi:hypothetical protein
LNLSSVLYYKIKTSMVMNLSWTNLFVAQLPRIHPDAPYCYAMLTMPWYSSILLKTWYAYSRIWTPSEQPPTSRSTITKS